MYKKAVFLLTGILLVTGCNSANSSSESPKQTVSEYHSRVEDLQASMMEAGIKAEEMTYQYYSVWYDAIHEDFVQIGDNIAIDFEGALYWQHQEFDSDGSIADIEEQMSLIEKQISDLKNPPKEYREIYETQLEMYLSLKALVSQAIDPSGSLNSFSDETDRLINDIIDANNKYDVQLPEIE